MIKVFRLSTSYIIKRIKFFTLVLVKGFVLTHAPTHKQTYTHTYTYLRTVTQLHTNTHIHTMTDNDRHRMTHTQTHTIHTITHNDTHLMIHLHT